MLAIVALAKRFLRLDEADNIVLVPREISYSSSLQLTQQGIDWSTGGLETVEAARVPGREPGQLRGKVFRAYGETILDVNLYVLEHEGITAWK